jgi:hypothetical protein
MISGHAGWFCWLCWIGFLGIFGSYANILVFYADSAECLRCVLPTLDGWLKLLDSYTDYASLLSMEDMLAAWLYFICRLSNYAGNAVWLARQAMLIRYLNFMY